MLDSLLIWGLPKNMARKLAYFHPKMKRMSGAMGAVFSRQPGVGGHAWLSE